MKPENRAEFIQVLKQTAALIGCKPLPPEGAQLFFDLLANYDINEVKTAFHIHLRSDTGQFMPKPADIIKHLEGSSETKADIAWTKAHKAITAAGSYDTVVFDDAIIHAVISDMGGWVEFCKGEEAELPFKRNEFVRRYRGLLNRKFDYPRKLIGLAESHNTSKGHEVAKPVVIGNKEVARLVYKGGNNKPAVAISFEPLERILAGALPSPEEAL